MKNVLRIIIATTLLFVGCTSNYELDYVSTNNNTFYASIESLQTRTYINNEGKLQWTENDQITIFKGTTRPKIYQYTSVDSDNYGSFSDVTPASDNNATTSNSLDANYAIYPHIASTTISDQGVISYIVPATQHYAENSFGLGANTMVAVTESIDDNSLAFKNVNGYFEFSLYGDITVQSIEFKGNNNEPLAGRGSITMTYGQTPSIMFDDDATTTLTLDCGDGIALGSTETTATKFLVVVPAMTYQNGITIKITDTNGFVMEKSTSQSITIKRSTIQPLSAFLVKTSIYIPDANFKNIVLASYDTNNDGDISIEEANTITALDLSNASPKIKSLEGIQYFTNLKSLDCSNNELTTINLSNNTLLETLIADNLALNTIDLSNNTNLTTYSFTGNQELTQIQVCNDFSMDDCSFTSAGNNPSLIISNADNKRYFYIGQYTTTFGSGGVVYEISNGGQNGKLVSTEASMMNWGWSGEDAIAWCNNYGTNWYLPSQNELQTIYTQKSTINNTFVAHNFTKLYGEYWASGGMFDEAEGYDMTYGVCITNHLASAYKQWTRAVLAF